MEIALLIVSILLIAVVLLQSGKAESASQIIRVEHLICLQIGKKEDLNYLLQE